jgi:RNA polymerase sigma-70 factor (ECF subfamily)
LNSDWDCLLRAQKGEKDSCCELIERHQSRLMALALLITGCSVAADDVVQETFVRALNARLRDTSGTVQGFLGTIAYRLALKESSRAGRNVNLELLDPTDRTPGPLENVLINERDRLVARTIGALDDDHRDVLVLRFYGGHSYEEIAGVLKVPIGTVKSRLFYAVKSCREKLREKGVLK